MRINFLVRESHLKKKIIIVVKQAATFFVIFPEDNTWT